MAQGLITPEGPTAKFILVPLQSIVTNSYLVN